MNSSLESQKIQQENSIAKDINILLVDDRPENLISLESIIEMPHRTIMKASSGAEALKLASETKFGLILLDVQMPEMDGFEVARNLRSIELNENTSVIFVTAISKDEKYALQGYAEGAVDYLQKPLEINIVKAKVDLFERLFHQRIELEEYSMKMEEINKQLDEFVYIVSHDLKAPLRGIASVSSFLEDELGPEPKPEVLDLLNLIKSRTSRMQNLIDGILHYSRMSKNKTQEEKVDVKELINNIIDLIAHDTNVTFEIPDKLPVLFTEKIKLHEVLQNLISNGIKYNKNESPKVTISCEEKETEFVFGVKDNGIGLKPEHFDKIFAIFQTLMPKDKVDSTGIGLTIVKKLVEQQNGKITVHSVYGEGSTFSFTWRK